jgi:hypothetical protein
MSKLNVKQILYCCKPLKFNGKSYEAGDPFPWQKNGCSSRRLQILIDTRNLQSEFTEEEPDTSVVEDSDIETPKKKKKKRLIKLGE